MSITPASFNAAVGLVMQHAQSGIGWIAAANTTSHMSTSSSSECFTTTVTHKETANTKSVWTAVLPEGAAQVNRPVISCRSPTRWKVPRRLP